MYNSNRTVHSDDPYADFWTEFLRSMRELNIPSYRAGDVITVTLRLSPLRPVKPYVKFRKNGAEVDFGGSTVVRDGDGEALHFAFATPSQGNVVTILDAEEVHDETMQEEESGG